LPRRSRTVIGRDLDAELADLEKKTKVRKATKSLEEFYERESFRERINARRKAEGKPPLRGNGRASP
jgi:hypothetical protein